MSRWDLADFTQDKACELSRVPDVFPSGDEYFATLIKNCFAEYSELHRKITSEEFVEEQPVLKGRLEVDARGSWIVRQGGRASLPSQGTVILLMALRPMLRLSHALICECYSRDAWRTAATEDL